MGMRIISDKLMNKESTKLHHIDVEEPIDRDLETIQRIDKILKRLDQIEND